MSAPFYAVFGLFIVLGAFAYLCDRVTKRTRHNRYRRGVLPPPSKEALRTHTTQAVT